MVLARDIGTAGNAIPTPNSMKIRESSPRDNLKCLWPFCSEYERSLSHLY